MDVPALIPPGADMDHWFLARAAFVLGLSGLIFGYDIGVISGALPQMTARFSLHPIQQGLVVSLLSIGSAAGGPVSGFVCDHIGRRRTVHLQNVLFAIGTLLICAAESLPALLVGRFVVGVGASFSAVASLAYLCEVSPANLRGRMTSTYEMLVVIGILLAWCVDFGLAGVEGGWRWMFGGILVVAMVQTLGMLRIPESPRWLLSRGQEAQSLEVLEQMCPSSAAAERTLMHLRAEEGGDGSSHGTSAGGALGVPDAPRRMRVRELAHEVLEWRLPVVLGVCVGLFQHFSGGVLVRNYAGDIFRQGGVAARTAGLFLVVMGVAKVVCTAGAIAAVDRVGRRPLLLAGATLILGGMATLAVGFAAIPGGDHEAPQGDAERIAGDAPSAATALLVGTLLVICGYSLSYGPLVWLLWAEVFPTAHRGALIGLTSFIASMAMFANNLCFEPLASSLGPHAVFTAYAFVNALGLLCLAWLMPETRGQTPEVIRDRIRVRITMFCSVRCASASASTGEKATHSSSTRAHVKRSALEMGKVGVPPPLPNLASAKPPHNLHTATSGDVPGSKVIAALESAEPEVHSHVHDKFDVWRPVVGTPAIGAPTA